mgnify:CR=1 FL=1
MSTLFKHPIWAMAFRPFYSLAALYGALSILLWGFGYQGTPELSGFYWHAHEMIWGYAGLVVIAFLLTAVATWTGQPPTRGGALAGLTAFWLAARIAAFIPGWGAVASGIAGTVFFGMVQSAWPSPYIAAETNATISPCSPSSYWAEHMSHSTAISTRLTV